MELLTVVDDFFVTASLALLLTFIFLKLFEAMNDTHTTPKRHVVHQPLRPVSHSQPLTVQSPQTKSKIRVISPIQPATCVETLRKVQDDDANIQPVPSLPIIQLNPVQTATCEGDECKTEEATIEPVSLVPTPPIVDLISPVQSATCVENASKIEDITVQPVATCEETKVGPVSQVDLISPVQAATCVENESKIEDVVEPAETDESNDTVDLIRPDQTATCIETENEIEEGATVESDSSGVEVSVVDKKENDDVDVDIDDDDWEGIERSELEKVFMAATEFVNGEDNRLSDVQMELYGLHKVATEGPCREPQPMPLKLFARAKWNAWQKLGNMSPDDAMEQYITLLSDKVPGWMKDTSAGMSEDEPTRPEVFDSAASDLSSTLPHQQMTLTERELEQESDSQDSGTLTGSVLEDNVKK